MTASYARGPRDVPLLDETIGENLRRTVERFADREALVVRHQGYRATYAELWEPGRPRGARPARARRRARATASGIWAPNRYEWVVTQFATARVGAILVTINPAYKAGRARVRAAPRPASACCVLARGFRDADYVAMLAEVRAAARAARRDRARGRLGALAWPTAPRVADAELAEREATLRSDDPINIQYTSGTTGLPEGRDALAPQHPQQRLLHRRGRWATPSATACACRCRSTTASAWCSARSPAPPTAPAWSCPARRSTRARCSRRSRPSAAPRCTACRRCSSPSSSTPASTRFDLSQPAHRA